MTSLQTLSIYLLKPDVTTPRDALRAEAAELSEHRLTIADTEGTVFVAALGDHEPDWVALVKPVTEPPVEARSLSTSAVLVLQSAGRWFAVTFGYGRMLLDPTRYERRFGLKCALNAVDPEQLRAAQSRTFNDHALHTQRQISRQSRIEALELDVERDLVVALSGAVSDPQLGLRIDGRDAARLTCRIAAVDLPAKCTNLLAISALTHYRTAFPWIDTIEEVGDPAEIADLEARASDRLAQGRFSGFDLYPPELVNDEIVYYRLRRSHGGLIVTEPDVRLLTYAIPNVTTGIAARTALEHHRLLAFNSHGQEVARWSLWDCLHLEMSVGGQRVVLDAGRWYRIERDFANDVDTFVSSLTPSGLPLPSAERDEAEGDYNRRAAQDTGYALLDQRTIVVPGRTPIEACDIFAPSGHLVHVKRRKGGSGPLSHLIGQAAVSANLLLDEPAFRNGLRARLATADPGLERAVEEPAPAGAHPVVLALITNTAATGHVGDRLPFFTKVFLRQNARRLQNMGFTVHLDEIAVNLPQVSSRRPSTPRRRKRRPAPTPRTPHRAS